MKNEEAYAALMKREPQWLARPIEELVKIQAVGSVYLATHKELLKKIKSGQIHLAEEDRKSKLADGQAIGEALLDVEVKIGQLLPSAEEARAGRSIGRAGKIQVLPDEYAGRKGRDGQKAAYARALAANPAAVAAIKAEAKQNEDIPTKTAVLNRIKYEKEKEYNEKAKEKKKDLEIGLIASLEEQQYLNALERVIMILPQQPPKNWNEKALKIASGYVAIINKRLEAFNGQTIKSNAVRSIGNN